MSLRTSRVIRRSSSRSSASGSRAWTTTPTSTRSWSSRRRREIHAAAWAVLALLSAGCTREAPALDAATLAAAEYAVAALDGVRVTLRNGHFVDEANQIDVRLTEWIVSGDLDGDGTPDAAAVLSVTMGGSGVFMDLAAVVAQGGRAVNTGTLTLGDRVKVESIAIRRGVIVVGLVTHAPADPLCCPTQRVTQSYRLEDGVLRPLANRSE